MTPMEELAALVAVAAALFYEAEHGVNDKVVDMWDAVHYITSSLSVGYTNLFPVTPAGKAIGSFVMVVGPALSARALDRPLVAGERVG